MPTVPYDPVPRGPAIQGTGASAVGINAPSAAFGTTVAGAVKEMGGDIQQAGNELWNRAVALKQLENETAAKEADANYMMEVGQLHAQYSALQGADAVKAFPKYQQDIQEARQRHRASLPNDVARRMFDSSALSTMSRTIFNGAGHAAAEQKRWAIGSAKSQMDLDTKTINDNPEDDRLFQDKLNRIRESARDVSSLQGFDEGGPQEQDLILKATSRAWAQRIQGQAKVKPFDAATMLDKHRKEMTEEDYIHTDNVVRGQGRAVGAVNIASEVWEQGRETDTRAGASMETMEQQARDKAKALSPDDPILEQHAVTALRTRVNQARYSEHQELLTNRETVNGAILAGVQNEQELRADPKVNAAINALPKKEQLNIPAAIYRYNAAKTKDANDKNYMRLWGQAQSDSTDAIRQFLETDITKEQLNQQQMRNLMAKQAKLREVPLGDPRVTQAVGWIKNAKGAELQALGIYNRNKDDPDDYDHYVGVLQTALESWQETHNKPATYDDVVNKIAPQVLQQKAVPGWLWGTNNKPIYKLTLGELTGMPADKIEAYKTDLRDQVAKRAQALGIDPPEISDFDIMRAYMQEQFTKLYSKGKDQTSVPRARPTVPVSQ